jgi:EAL domain-containing protein (putative c-di-GMP-specific phosphodiesterase class I)
LGIPPSQVVIELTEQSPTEDFALLDTALHHYRAMGFSIALDDLGAGYSSLRLWSELRPDYVKIDRHFIDGIHLDAVKREFVGSILKMAKASRAQVIAEGIELPEELAVLAEMGVDLLQGYLMNRQLTTVGSKPSSASVSAASSAWSTIVPTARMASSLPRRRTSHVPYGTGRISAAGGGTSGAVSRG